MTATKIKRPETLKCQALEEIKRLMLSGELQKEEIYSANYFAKILGISRTPAREALLDLCSEGYLVPVLGRGFQIRKLTSKEIKDFFETRQLIEGYVVSRLKERITPHFIEALEQITQEMEHHNEAGDEIRFIEADKAFHMTFVTLYDNTQLAAIMENIRNQMIVIGRKALMSKGRTFEVIIEHRNIIRALIQQDYDETVRLMQGHIRITETCVLSLQDEI